MTEMELVGKVSHYYTKIGVAVIDLEKDLKVGDRISIQGQGTDIQQTVESIQIEHDNVESAKAGTSVGIKIAGKVREKDMVYRVHE